MNEAAPERVVVVDVSDLAPGAVRVVEAGSLSVLLCNAGGRIYAVQGHCSHEAVSLGEGRLRGCILQCPLHGARFDVRDGRVLGPPARRPLATFAVSVAGGRAEIRLAAGA